MILSALFPSSSAHSLTVAMIAPIAKRSDPTKPKMIGTMIIPAAIARASSAKKRNIPKVSSSSLPLGTEETPNHTCTVGLVSSSSFVSLPELVAHHGNGRLDRPPLPPKRCNGSGKPDPSRDARLTVSWIRLPHGFSDRTNNLGGADFGSNPASIAPVIDSKLALSPYLRGLNAYMAYTYTKDCRDTGVMLAGAI